MLVELAIRDLALIERAELAFGPGLNVITGETGAGKSLLIGALELLYGRRGRSGIVRQGASQARVEGRFLLPLDDYGARVAGWLREHLGQVLEDLEEEAGGSDLELILTRTVGRDGRGRAHVNHRPVTQRILRELAAQLVEVHGQHDHQKLFDCGEQRQLLDTFGGLEDALAGYRERRGRWLELAGELEEFAEGEAERLQRLDLVRLQAAELAAAAPDSGEHDALLGERQLLRHAAELGGRLGALLQELSEGEGAALDAVRRAERELEEWEERVAELAPPAASLREACAHLEEAVSALLSFVDGVEADPARLEVVEDRLGELERLARKYHTDVAGLAERHAALDAELEGLEGDGRDRGALEEATAKALRSVEQAAGRLGKARKRSAAKLSRAVAEGLGDLGLEHAGFEVALPPAGSDEEGLDAERRRLGVEGAETVEFLLAANRGEAVQPLRQVASGGEAARILLALRGALAVRQSTPTLVFDEIDAGVGGRLGPRVGRHLGALGRHHQVLCVTHLPAIAAAASAHLRVTKEVAGGRTRTSVAQLEGEERVGEIADMIAGGKGQATARAEAQRLLEESPR